MVFTKQLTSTTSLIHLSLFFHEGIDSAIATTKSSLVSSESLPTLRLFEHFGHSMVSDARRACSHWQLELQMECQRRRATNRRSIRSLDSSVVRIIDFDFTSDVLISKWKASRFESGFSMRTYQIHWICLRMCWVQWVGKALEWRQA